MGSNDGYAADGTTVTGTLFAPDGDVSLGTVTCGPVPSGAVATSCSSKHSIDADDWTPVLYCLW